jgi:homoserine trans-succinylase
MNTYTEEQFVYFMTDKVKRLGEIKEGEEEYWTEYKELQDWLQQNKLSTEFINWVEKKVNIRVDY